MSYDNKVNTKRFSLFFSKINQINLVKCSFDIINTILIDALTQSNTFNLNYSNYPLFIKSDIIKDNLKYMDMVNEIIDKNQGNLTMNNYSNEELREIVDNYTTSIKSPWSHLNIKQNEKKNNICLQNIIDVSNQSDDSSFFTEGLVQESTIDIDSITYKSSTNTNESNTYTHNSNNPSTKSTKIIKIGKKNERINFSKEKTNVNITQKNIPPRPESQKEITSPISFQKFKVLSIDVQKGAHQSKQSLSPDKLPIYQKKIVNSPKKGLRSNSKQLNQIKSNCRTQNNNSLQINMIKPIIKSSPSAYCLTQSSLITNKSLSSLNFSSSHKGSSKLLSSYASIMKKNQIRDPRNNISCDIVKKQLSIDSQYNKTMTKQYSTTKNTTSFIQINNNTSPKKNNTTIDSDSRSKNKSKPKMNFDIDLCGDSELFSSPSKYNLNKEKNGKTEDIKENKMKKKTKDQSKPGTIKELLLPINFISIESNTLDKLQKLKELKSKQTQQFKMNQLNRKQTPKNENNLTNIKNTLSPQSNYTKDNISLIDTFSFQNPEPKSQITKNSANTSINSNPSYFQTEESSSGNKNYPLVNPLFKLNFKVNTIMDESVFNELNFLK